MKKRKKTLIIINPLKLPLYEFVYFYVLLQLIILLCVWLFISQRKANYLQQAHCRVTQENEWGVLTIIQPPAQDFDPFTAKYLGASTSTAHSETL